MKKIRFLLPAVKSRCLRQLLNYETRVTNLGENFLTTIERAVSMIFEQPKTWPEIGYGIQKYIIRRFPYSILYRSRFRGDCHCRCHAPTTTSLLLVSSFIAKFSNLLSSFFRPGSGPGSGARLRGRTTPTS